MKKFLFVFVAMFLSVPAMARVCMVNSPTVIATQTQLANKADKTELAEQVALLSARIAALENPSLEWLSKWISANGTLTNSTVSDGNSTWSVTANQGGTGTQTVTGVSRCSDTGGTNAVKGNPSETSGGSCWCKMTTPRAGAWVYYSAFNGVLGPASACGMACSSACANHVQSNSNFRAAVLSLP